MYCGKKISVVLATYNGEKFIQEQLESILTQTVRPDEIVVSDDGSKDHTLEIVRSIANSDINSNIRWVILTDNQRRGYTGNFEHALRHSTGDFTFFCDQDDVWSKEKVHHVVEEFIHHSDAWLICHNAILVDAELQALDDPFMPNFPREQINNRNGDLFKLDKEHFLTKSITETFPGMVMCLSRECINYSLPFPNMNGHDTWVFFCAVCEDRAYYLPEVLTYYRIHGENVSSPVESRRNIFNRIKKYKKMLSIPRLYSSPLYEQSSAMLKRLDTYGVCSSEKAYEKAFSLFRMSSLLREAELSGRIKGCLMVLKLHATNASYHAVGKRQISAHVLNVLLHSKTHRRELL